MIVMKFGGTSVEDARAIERVAAIVKERLPQHPVVVVSAMARVTDTLLTMARAAGAGERKTALKLCRSLQERHYNTASELLGTALFTDFHSELGSDFESLDELLRGISAVGELTPRTTDHVAAFGEILSSKIVAAAFSAQGLNSEFVDAREVLVTDSSYMQAVPQQEETNERLQTKVKPLLDAGQVPVMGGFVGASRAGITTTIGRGGSDFSAAIVGAGLSAERIEIWTDVDGILTTDPRICKDARRIKVISFDEAAELAYFGAKVLHPATVLAGDPEEYSRLRSEFAESLLRRDEDYHPRPAGEKYFQSHCGEETHHYCGRGCAAHAFGSRLSACYLRGLRPAQGCGRRGLNVRSQRFAHGGFESGDPRAGRRFGQTG